MPANAIVWLISSLATVSVKSAYDLGGPCIDNRAGGPWEELGRAEIKEDWPRVVELQKIFVRNMCENNYRWLNLVEALLRVGKLDGALLILGEVHGRGMDLTDENIRSQAALLSYVHSEEFKATPLGQAFAQRMTDAGAGRGIRKEAFRAKLAAMPESLRPPKTYVAVNVCPGECCTFRQWRALHDGVLVDRPRGTKVVARFHKGDAVTGITGNIYVEPLPVAILHDLPDDPEDPGSSPHLPVGEVIFLLDYVELSTYHYWYQGKVGPDVVGVDDDECLEPGPHCWAEPIEGKGAINRRFDQWWVKVRLGNGKVGWTSKIVFGGIDACA